MDFARFWNTSTGRISFILIGIVLMWIGVEITKPWGYVLEAVGLVVVLASVVNIHRVGRSTDAQMKQD